MYVKLYSMRRDDKTVRIFRTNLTDFHTSAMLSLAVLHSVFVLHIRTHQKVVIKHGCTLSFIYSEYFHNNQSLP